MPKTAQQWETERLYCELATWPQNWPEIAASFDHSRATLADYLVMQVYLALRERSTVYESLRGVYLEFRVTLEPADLAAHMDEQERISRQPGRRPEMAKGY